jgi:hypothetical protein
MNDTQWQKFTIRMSDMDAQWIRTAYEVARKTRIDEGNKPQSFNQFLVRILTEHLSDPDVIVGL